MNTNYADFEYEIEEIVGEATGSAYEQGTFEGMSEAAYNQFVADLRSTARRAAEAGDMDDAATAVQEAIDGLVAA